MSTPTALGDSEVKLSWVADLQRYEVASGVTHSGPWYNSIGSFDPLTKLSGVRVKFRLLRP